jgi:hypothetical protein
MSIYNDWGFTGNPFLQTPLLPNEQGATLLVGRDKEEGDLAKRLTNPPKLPVLEGANGVGKTSLINVTAYRLFKRFLDSGSPPLFVPCHKSFQLTPGKDVETFCDEVLMEVAQTLIDHGQLIKTKYTGRLANSEAIDRWLNSPVFRSWQGGLPILSAGAGSQASESAGFQRSGFRKTVLQWLSEVFPNNEFGAVICVIDNLELLQTSETARALLEQLRDPLFTVPGIRCVLCGATGITWSLASSMRLEGVLHNPLEILGLTSALAVQILESRSRAFVVNEQAAYLPITAADFEQLYEVLDRNLRAVLSYSDNFCMWASDQSERPETNEHKREAFGAWFTQQCTDVYRGAEQSLTKRGWEVFDKAIELGGVFAPNDYAKFGCNSMQALRPWVQNLEDVQLVKSWKDDKDQRRKSIVVTPRGRLAAHYRKALRTKPKTR